MLAEKTVPVSGLRFLRRLAAFVLMLVLMDVLVRQVFPPVDQDLFAKPYRLPENQEMLWLPSYVDFIRQQPGPKIVFIGSSPTYGVAVRDVANTYPFAYQQALEKSGQAVRCYNVSSKGFLLSDQYFVLKALIDSADVFFIQLNYHTFGDYILSTTRLRHPELPERLGTTVLAEEALALHVRATPQWALNAHFRQWIKGWWYYYRERDRMAASLFGSTPEAFFFQRFQQLRGKKEAQEEKLSKPLIDQPPTRQMMVLKRYTETSQYQLKEENSELFFLVRTLELLKQHHKPAIFFMNPINGETLDYYEMFDWKQYQANTAALASRIRQQGFTFLDYNRTEPLAGEHFADISHTLDSGGQEVGARLARDTAPEVLGHLKGVGR